MSSPPKPDQRNPDNRRRSDPFLDGMRYVDAFGNVQICRRIRPERRIGSMVVTYLPLDIIDATCDVP